MDASAFANGFAGVECAEDAADVAGVEVAVGWPRHTLRLFEVPPKKKVMGRGGRVKCTWWLWAVPVPRYTWGSGLPIPKDFRGLFFQKIFWT